MDTETKQPQWGWMTVEQAAAFTGLPVGTIRRLLKEREVPGVDLGNRRGWQVRPEALQQWMLAKEREQTAK